MYRFGYGVSSHKISIIYKEGNGDLKNEKPGASQSPTQCLCHDHFHEFLDILRSRFLQFHGHLRETVCCFLDLRKPQKGSAESSHRIIHLYSKTNRCTEVGKDLLLQRYQNRMQKMVLACRLATVKERRAIQEKKV